MPPGDPDYWSLLWDLVGELRSHLAAAGIPVDVDRRRPEARWTPAVDLALAERRAEPWHDWEDPSLFPARAVTQVWSGNQPTRLVRGTILTCAGYSRNPWLDGDDSFVWSVEDPTVDVPFLWSADDARGGVEGLLATDLIVPSDHPIIGDDERADRLVRDLQEITSAFRAAHVQGPDRQGGDQNR